MYIYIYKYSSITPCYTPTIQHASHVAKQYSHICIIITQSHIIAYVTHIYTHTHTHTHTHTIQHASQVAKELGGACGGRATGAVHEALLEGALVHVAARIVVFALAMHFALQPLPFVGVPAAQHSRASAARLPAGSARRRPDTPA